MALPPTSPAPRAPAGRPTALDGFARFICQQLKVPLSAVSLLQGDRQHIVSLVSAEQGPQADLPLLDLPPQPQPLAAADLHA